MRETVVQSEPMSPGHFGSPSPSVVGGAVKGRRRQKRAGITREKIVDAAARQFDACGFAAASINTSSFNSFEEALRYYNLKYEIIYKVMLKEIGPISLSLLLKAVEDIMENLPSYFQKIQLNPDGTINEELLLKSVWYHDFDQHIGDFLRGLEEILFTEIYAVKKHLGVDYEQQVLKWINGIGS